ncbi:MAG: hypothetical protein OEZ38_10150 [Gammaproteobacteria bacterium]|nr:hypothetical protein [Gammaproteobacteria bacterium]
MKLLLLMISFMAMFSMGIYESKNRSVAMTKETQKVTASTVVSKKVTEAEDAMQTLESIEVFEASEVMEDFDLQTAIETLNTDTDETPVIKHNTADAVEMIITGS